MKHKTRPVLLKDFAIGDGNFSIIAGPCAIESKDQFLSAAEHIKNLGVKILRGGLFKLRTSPKNFQGLGIEGVSLVQEVKEKTGLCFVSETTDPRQIDQMIDLVDVFQVGARNMYNYPLLKELGKTKKPVLLKRGFASLVEEWIEAASYITNEGNEDVILCTRGIRTFERITRNTFDLSAAVYIKKNTSFPILVDPSHAAGNNELITPLSLAAAASGVDGIMVEIHPTPSIAKSDGQQALDFDSFQQLMVQLEKILKSLDRKLL